MAKDTREIKRWITVRGNRVPIFEGESVSEAIKKRLHKKDESNKKDTTNKTTTKKSDNEDDDNETVRKSNSSKPKHNIDKDNTPKTDTQKQIEKDNEEKERRLTLNKKEAEARKKESDYQEELKRGNSVKKSNDGKLYFKGKEIEPLSLGDAVTGPDGNSLGAHIENGKLTPKRLEVHRKIIEDYFSGKTPYAPNEEKVVMFTGGGGASGKGGFSKDIGKYYSQNKNPLVVDADEIKKSLAKADGVKINNKNTGYYHEESSALAKQIYSTATAHNFPVLFDGTSTNPDSVLKKLTQAKNAGYKAEMCFLFSDFTTVRANSLKRYEKSERFVPPDALLGAHKKAYSSIMAFEGKFDSFKVYDNAGYKMQLVATGKKGQKYKIIDDEGWDRLVNSKKDFTLTDKQKSDWLADRDKITAKLEALAKQQTKKKK